MRAAALPRRDGFAYLGGVIGGAFLLNVLLLLLIAVSNGS